VRFSQVELVPEAGYREPGVPGCLVLTRPGDIRAAYGNCRLLPAPDLERCLLVMVHRGPCPTGGHAIRISGIEQRGDEVTVVTARRDPRPGDSVTMMITYPRDCVAVERSELAFRGRLHFHFVDERGATLGRVTAEID